MYYGIAGNDRTLALLFQLPGWINYDTDPFNINSVKPFYTDHLKSNIVLPINSFEEMECVTKADTIMSNQMIDNSITLRQLSNSIYRKIYGHH